MYALALIRYRKPLPEVESHLEAHRAYLRGLFEQKLLLASGPFDPRTGGALILHVPDDAADITLDRIRDQDPFTLAAVAQYELLPWNPVIGLEGLETLL
ncbi:MAG: YciI family protein [Candidatus Eisenbacteria bacterium]